MTSLLDIYNLALSACGSEGMADVDEASREGDLVRLHYPHARDLILSAAPWPSVRKHARLAALAEDSDTWVNTGPAPGYTNSFSVPNDLQHPYHLVSYGRFDYSLGTSGRQISCNEVAPILVYNSNNTTVAQWELGLVDAVIAMLAMRISRALTGQASIVQEQFQLLQNALSSARGIAANSSDTREEVIPDWFVARGIATSSSSRFFFPFQEIRYPGVA